MVHNMRCALTVAGSDSIGGAGIQADVKAMASLGVHAASVVTAVTAQNTREVARIMPVPEDMVQAQLDAVLGDADIKAVKTGMLYSPGIVGIVADALEDHGMPLIVDPVMVAGVGDSLAEKDLHRALKKELLPMCELVTPNRHEAEILSGIRIDTPDDAMLACELIGKEGTSVLLKGGHMNTRTVVDYLYLSSEFTKMENPRLERAGHGGGCTLSSYITAHMAKGIDIVNSVLRSRDLMQNSIASMYSVGRGDKVVNPIVRMNDESVRFRILDSVDAAARRIMDNVPDIWVPSSGINIAYAAPNAAGPEDIAAIERRIVNHNGRLRKNGSAKFGSAESLSFVLLTVMKSHQETRAVMSLAFREEILDIMEEVGLSAVSLSRKNGIAEATAEALRGVNTLPDVLVDREAPRNDRFIRILGRDPEDIMGKLESIL
jgi:hydroxymethylpyrimidine/phosphomethylpyrimidine kinase